MTRSHTLGSTGQGFLLNFGRLLALYANAQIRQDIRQSGGHACHSGFQVILRHPEVGADHSCIRNSQDTVLGNAKWTIIGGQSDTESLFPFNSRHKTTFKSVDSRKFRLREPRSLTIDAHFGQNLIKQFYPVIKIFGTHFFKRL